MGAAFVETLPAGVLSRMESPLSRSLVPHFRRLAEEIMEAARKGDMWMRQAMISPGLMASVGPGKVGEEPSVVVECYSQAHNHEVFVYYPGGREDLVVAALSRWAEAAPGEAARFIMDIMSDALMAGATADDLVFTIGNAVASTVIET